MKTLTIEQMENVHAGSFAKTMSCISQVAGGMGILASIATIGIFAINPIGWGIFALGAISLLSGVASDPSACD
jgi:hypothetical protein